MARFSIYDQSPNTVAAVMGVALLALITMRRGRGMNIYHLALFFLLSIIMALTQSRGALVGMACCALFLLILGGKEDRCLLGLIVFMCFLQYLVLAAAGRSTNQSLYNGVAIRKKLAPLALMRHWELTYQGKSSHFNSFSEDVSLRYGATLSRKQVEVITYPLSSLFRLLQIRGYYDLTVFLGCGYAIARALLVALKIPSRWSVRLRGGLNE